MHAHAHSPIHICTHTSQKHHGTERFCSKKVAEANLWEEKIKHQIQVHRQAFEQVEGKAIDGLRREGGEGAGISLTYAFTMERPRVYH